MKIGSKRMIPCVLITALVCLLGMALALAQNGSAGKAATATPASAATKPLTADQVHKDIRLLKGMPEDEFMDAMGFYCASVGESCEFCHGPKSVGSWDAYADDTPMKTTARKMIQMVNQINKDNFDGRRMLTCYSCHRGGLLPEVTPNLAQIYETPGPEDPNIITRGPDSPTAEQILDKYIQAVGGAQKAATITSFVAKGTYSGYETGLADAPYEIYSKAPGLRATTLHAANGLTTTTFDGHSAWIAAPDTDKPVPLYELTGSELDGTKVVDALAFPALVKQTLTGWKVGFPIPIDGHDAQIIQGLSPAKSPVKLYFDSESGLLVRSVRYDRTRVGINPAQIDYSDYRDVDGVKMPFHLLVSWADNQVTIQLSSIELNVPIDAAKFVKPAPSPQFKVGVTP